MSTPDVLRSGAHAFTTASGATLTYFVRGSGPRLLVNVAPGWGCASELYQNTFGFLEPHFTVVHLDVRGTRGSSFPADLHEMSSWHMAKDIEALRVHLERDVLDGLVGHSNGGCIALWYAARFPARVAKLVLLGCQLLGSASVSNPATKAILDARPDRDAVEAFYTWGKNIGSFKTDDDFATCLHAFLGLYVARPEKHLDAVKAAFANKPQLACMQAQAPAEAQHADQRPHLGDIAASTLVIVGQEDFICPVPVSELIAAGIKDSSLHVMPNVGHFSWIEETARFTSLLRTFLKF
ncbi:alpha/beta-hydrolase [Auricularia subglabra TFB-10046 SS5]|nr:alpha/beta-hydrolase [Auricularia subglabra TFB-10046 SS5]